MVDQVSRDTLTNPLKDALERFEAELAAISYVESCEPTYKDGQIRLLTWKGPDGHHVVFRDGEGWYEYERLQPRNR